METMWMKLGSWNAQLVGWLIVEWLIGRLVDWSIVDGLVNVVVSPGPRKKELRRLRI